MWPSGTAATCGVLSRITRKSPFEALYVRGWVPWRVRTVQCLARTRVRAAAQHPLHLPRRAGDSADLQRHLDPHGWRAESIRWNLSPRPWLHVHLDPVGLHQVAAATQKLDISHRVCATFRPRNDVVEFEIVRRLALHAAAVSRCHTSAFTCCGMQSRNGHDSGCTTMYLLSLAA